MKKILASFLFLWLFSFAFAHQPRITRDLQNSEQSPIKISNPEISQAFYGQLRWQPDVYQIVSDTGFLLYANIVVPDLTGQNTDFVLQIKHDKNMLANLDGKTIQRSGFYEEFAGDQYLRWPEREKEVPAGIYTIIVSSPTNQGKYSLAVWKIESFPFSEIINTFNLLPSLKTVFFQKPRTSLFEGSIVRLLVGTVSILLGALLILIYSKQKRKQRH